MITVARKETRTVPSQHMSDASLLERFVASFGKFDEMSFFEGLDKIALGLRIPELDALGRIQWRPRKQLLEPQHLDPLYSKLPARFSPLYKELILSYRWAEVDLGTFRLVPNPPGENLTGLLAEIERDRVIFQKLIPVGYIQFGRGPDMDYDPVCFDNKSRTNSRDYRIVKIDHEEILCNDRVKVVKELAPGFRVLVEETIKRAESVQN